MTKVLTLLLFVASLTAMTSCKKVDKNLIIGSWKCSSATLTTLGVPMDYPLAEGMNWTFQSDGKLIAELVPELDIDNATLNYVISGNRLRVSWIEYDGDMEVKFFTIKELTNSKLTLAEFEDELDDDYLTLNFVRLQ